jgi:tetratricopeptide (TPR) repeat protein
MRRAPLLASLFLAGCTQMPWPLPAAPASVEELAARHQYVDALAQLQHQAGAPDYPERRTALLKAAERYQDELFSTIDDLVRRDLLAAAQLQLELALPQLPPSPTLERQLRAFEAARAQFVDTQLALLRELRGRHLLEEQPYYEKLIGVDGDAGLRAAVERYRKDAAFYGEQLREAGARAIDAGQFQRAVELLSTANRLHPTKPTADLLSAASRRQQAIEGREQHQRQAQRSQRYLDLRSAFRAAMARADYRSARTHLDAAEQLGSEHATEVDGWRRSLAEAVDGAVNQLTARGDRQYAEGKVEQALRSWNRANELRPSTELQSRIERAQRLMARYRELQERPPTPERDGGGESR